MVKIGHAQLLQVIAAVGGGQEIGGHLRVEHKAAGGDALGEQGAAQLFCAVGRLFDAGGEQPVQNVVIALQPVGQQQSGMALLPLLPGDTHPVQAGQGQHGHPVQSGPQRQQFPGPGGGVHHLALAACRKLRLLRRRTLPLGGGEVVFVNELGKFQV